METKKDIKDKSIQEKKWNCFLLSIEFLLFTNFGL